MDQRFTRTDTEVIQRARRKRREVIVLREDQDWLQEYSARPKDMLWRMAQRGALISLGAGRYAIADIGSSSPAYKAWQPMLHARLAPHGDYYLAGLSALVEHRLTDISPSDLFVVAGFELTSLRTNAVRLAGRQLRSAHTRRHVFGPEHGIEHIRLSRTEQYFRSNVARTLVDCLWHPELCGAPETWITAWGRGARMQLDPVAACRYSLALGPAVARRTGLMLELTGHGDIARLEIPGRAGRVDRAIPLDAHGPRDARAHQVDPFWNVAFNLPAARVEGWLSYGK